jgi:SAM-dependent methyltransferase
LTCGSEGRLDTWVPQEFVFRAQHANFNLWMAIIMGDTKDHYRGEAGQTYHTEKRGIPDRAYPWVARLRAAKFAAHVREDDVVLEYGVGAGWNLALLGCRQRLGHDVTPFLVETLASHRIQFVPDTGSVGSGTIDVVICHHTLEHTLQPSTVLEEIRRMLRPGGLLWLSVPYEKERMYRRFRPDEPNHHLYAWNVQTLGNLVEELGFDLREAGLGRFGYDRFAAVQADRWGLGEKGYRMIRLGLHFVRAGWEVRVLACKPSSVQG